VRGGERVDAKGLARELVVERVAGGGESQRGKRGPARALGRARRQEGIERLHRRDRRRLGGVAPRLQPAGNALLALERVLEIGAGDDRGRARREPAERGGERV